MSSNTDHNVLRLRVRQLVDSYPEPSVFGNCDCTSYSHFFLSIVLLTLGTYITVPTFMSSPHHILNILGRMWLIGPLCICCGIMVALKSILYLRKKSVLRMILRQRALLLGIQELAEEHRFAEATSAPQITDTGSALPPPYEQIQEGLPSYTEAIKSQPPPPPRQHNQCCCTKKQQQAFDLSLSCILTHTVANNASILAEAISLREHSTLIATSIAEISDFTISDNVF